MSEPLRSAIDMLRSTLLVTLCAVGAPLLAQAKKPTARAFHFDDYRSVVVLDMKALRSTGVWDEMNVSAMKMTFSMLEEQLGFELDHLDRVTMTRGKCALEGQEEGFYEVSVLEGNADLGEPVDVARGRYNLEPVGTFTLYTDQWGTGAFAAPEPRLHVYGPQQLLRDVLDGQPRAGLPSADVMAFTAGQKDNLLNFVIDIKNDSNARTMLEEMLGQIDSDMAWPEGDAPTLLGGRLAATGDEDDRHLMFEFVVRHGTVAEGLAFTERAGRAGIDMLKKLPQARLFRPLLKTIEFERHGTDATWRVDLGRARNVTGMLTTLMPLLFFVGTREVQAVQAGQILEVVEEPAEAPAPEKKGGDKPKKAGGN